MCRRFTVPVAHPPAERSIEGFPGSGKAANGVYVQHRARYVTHNQRLDIIIAMMACYEACRIIHKQQPIRATLLGKRKFLAIQGYERALEILLAAAVSSWELGYFSRSASLNGLVDHLTRIVENLRLMVRVQCRCRSFSQRGSVSVRPRERVMTHDVNLAGEPGSHLR
jgi:hypothetical protein